MYALSSVMCSLNLVFPEFYVPLSLTLLEVMTIDICCPVFNIELLEKNKHYFIFNIIKNYLKNLITSH